MNRGVDIDQGGSPEDDSENESQNNRGIPSQSNLRDQEWAGELRKADERSNEVRMRCEDLGKSNQKLEAQLKLSDEQIEKRDVEILRLGQLYQGGQNNDKLAMQYNQDQN